MITSSQIKHVMYADEYAQKHDKVADRELSALYGQAKDTSNGWESVAKEPAIFYHALAIAHRLVGEYYDY